jgi:soluble lytic murein transglycosylase-like protein
MIARSRKATQGWKAESDFRIICDCQMHARARLRWRRALRFTARGLAIVAAVPFAFAFDIPEKARNFDITALRQQIQIRAVRTVAQPKKKDPDAIPIFTTPAMSEQFISTGAVQNVATVDSYKEQYFRSHVPYGSIIYREARKNRLDPELVAAMVHTESDFRADLVSHKSAQGLMQIVPETASILGVANVFDPESNIAAGTRYFRYLLDRFDNERIALAAYNAGEGHVERCRCVPEFAETKSYIEKVNARASRYRQRVRSSYTASVRMRPDTPH